MPCQGPRSPFPQGNSCGLTTDQRKNESHALDNVFILEMAVFVQLSKNPSAETHTKSTALIVMK